MCEQEYILENYTLKEIYSHVFNTDEEICSYLTIINEDDKVHILEFASGTLTSGDKVNGRRFCDNIGTNTGYLYHSHPVVARSYPSVEDIMKLIKHPSSFKVSIIATRWGIYTVKNTNVSLAQNKVISQKVKNEYEEKIDKATNKIGILENKKGFVSDKYLTPEDFKGDFMSKYYKVRLTDKEIEYIRFQLEKIEKHTLMKLSFCPWSELRV